MSKYKKSSTLHRIVYFVDFLSTKQWPQIIKNLQFLVLNVNYSVTNYKREISNIQIIMLRYFGARVNLNSLNSDMKLRQEYK